MWAEWSEVDSRLAEALEACRRPPSWTSSFIGRRLEQLIKAQVSGLSRNPYVSKEAHSLTLEYCASLSRWIQTLREHQAWGAAHRETAWLSMLLNLSLQSSPEAVAVMQILTEKFPDWKTWAGWGEQDSQLSQALVPCFKHDPATTSQRLRIVVELLMAGVSVRSVLHSEVHTLALKLSSDLASQLQAFQLEGKWFKAQKESEWLSSLLGQSVQTSIGRAEAIQALESGFPDWKTWAVWCPDTSRLSAQERLNAKQRSSLCDLLRLEGPDFLFGEHGSMMEALVAGHTCHRRLVVSWGKMRLRIQSQNGVNGNTEDIFNRLSLAVHSACTASADEIDLLEYLSRKTIDESTLDILCANSIVGSSIPTVSSDVLNILKPRGRSLRMAAVMRLLPVLGQPSAQALRNTILTRLVNLISTSMQEMQAMIRNLENFDSVRELQAFGLGVQAAKWLQPHLNSSLGTLISKWPSFDTTSDLISLRSAVFESSHGELKPLLLQLDQYFTDSFITPDTIDLPTRSLIEALIQLWHQKSDPKKALALIIAQFQSPDLGVRGKCLRQLLTFPDEFIRDLYGILKTFPDEPDATCINIVNFFAPTMLLEYESSSPWREVVYHWVKDRKSTLVKYALTHLTVSEWLQWLSDLQAVFADIVLEDLNNYPSLLPQGLFEWTNRICRHWDTILRLEHVLGSGPATQCLLGGFDSKFSQSIEQILELLEHHFQESEDGRILQPAVQATIALLDHASGGNAKDICLALSMLTHTTMYGNHAYFRVLEVFQQSSQQVAEVFLVCWRQHPNLDVVDQWALEALAKLLGIQHCDDYSSIIDASDAVGDYVMNQVASLFDEANSLARQRRSLKARDLESTLALLAELGIDDTSSYAEDEIAGLPPQLIDVVEMVAKDVIELHVPLTHTALQRAGMGISSSQGLIVRLFVGSPFLPLRFCIHFDDELKGFAGPDGHSSWLALDGSDDEGTSCTGRANRATLQLGHLLSRHLLDGSKPLEETYKLLKGSLETLTQNCIICGISLGVQLCRSTTCHNPSCSATLLDQASLDIFLYDLRKDSLVGELMFTAIQTAASSDNIALLPECPLPQVAAVSNLLGTVANVAAVEDLASNDQCVDMGLSREKWAALLKWIFGHYGGFLVSASGKTRIPSMPGIHQFLLANAAPKLEKAFAEQMGALITKVVFHGTSLDRLYAILCQGLRVYSGDSSLQRHGAIYGRGIYVSAEPSTAMGYAHAYTSPVAGKGWQSNIFNNVSVLLGCEASGRIPGQRANGIYVIPNPDMLILRYIFLVPRGVSVPIANHVVPAMASVFASLRSGSL